MKVHRPFVVVEVVVHMLLVVRTLLEVVVGLGGRQPVVVVEVGEEVVEVACKLVEVVVVQQLHSMMERPPHIEQGNHMLVQQEQVLVLQAKI